MASKNDGGPSSSTYASSASSSGRKRTYLSQIVSRPLTLEARLVCQICKGLLEKPVLACKSSKCPNAFMCYGCFVQMHAAGTHPNCAFCRSGDGKSRRRLIGLRRVHCPCGLGSRGCTCQADTRACALWSEILTRYRKEIDFLNENRDFHSHDITISGSVSMEVLRNAAEAKPGDIIGELQALGAKKYPEEERLSEEYLRIYREQELEKEKEKEKRERQDAIFAKKIQEEDLRASQDSAASSPAHPTRPNAAPTPRDPFEGIEPDWLFEHEKVMQMEKKKNEQEQKDAMLAKQIASMDEKKSKKRLRCTPDDTRKISFKKLSSSSLSPSSSSAQRSKKKRKKNSARRSVNSASKKSRAPRKGFFDSRKGRS